MQKVLVFLSFLAVVSLVYLNGFLLQKSERDNQRLQEKISTMEKQLFSFDEIKRESQVLKTVEENTGKYVKKLEEENLFLKKERDELKNKTDSLTKSNEVLSLRDQKAALYMEKLEKENSALKRQIRNFKK